MTTRRRRSTRVMTEQTMAVDPSRLGEPTGHLSAAETTELDRALRDALGLEP